MSNVAGTQQQCLTKLRPLGTALAFALRLWLEAASSFFALTADVSVRPLP